MNRGLSPAARWTVAGLALIGVGLVFAGFSVWLLLRASNTGESASVEFSAVPAQVEIPAPELALTNLDGTDHALKDFRGEVLLVNLWATWCPPCAAEMPNLERFYLAHKADGFAIVAINDGESRAMVNAFAEQHGLTFQIWLDPTFQATDHAFKTRNLPTSYVVDRRGVIRLMWVGAISWANLERYVRPLIEEG